MAFLRFHFIFLYFWITKWQKLAHHKFRFSRKEGAVFWDTLPRGVSISTNNNALEEQGLSFFPSHISDHLYKLQILIKNPAFIDWPICTMLPIRHFCCYSDFSRQMSKIWSGPMSRERLHIQIWYRTKFYRTVVLAHEQVPFWSGLGSVPNFWYRKVPFTKPNLVRTMVR